MNCEKYRELISASLDDELSAEESRILAEHLQTCNACRKLKAELVEIHDLGLKRKIASMPAELEGSILANIRYESKAKKVYRQPFTGYYKIPRVAVWAAAAVIAGLLLSMAFQPLRPTGTYVSGQVSRTPIPQKVIVTERDVVSRFTINNATIKLPKGS